MDASISITPAQLDAARRTGHPPLVIDVRRPPAYLADDALIAGALRRDPGDVDRWRDDLPARNAVAVYCVHGREVSQHIAQRLRERGIDGRYLEGGMAAWRTEGRALMRKPAGASTRWITRERPKIDRIACPWLVARFIDSAAEFLYVPAGAVLDRAGAASAIPYDVPDAEYGHSGERCSFDAFIRIHALRDPALLRLGAIVRAADTSCLDDAPEAAGLLALSHGLGALHADDHELLRHGMVLYDALYAWCRTAPGATTTTPDRTP